MKINPKLCFAALTVVGAALAGPANAQVAPGSISPGGTTKSVPADVAPSADFNKLDTNRDGYIAKQEARRDKELSKAFDSYDTNKDGKLDSAEYSQLSATTPK